MSAFSPTASERALGQLHSHPIIPVGYASERVSEYPTQHPRFIGLRHPFGRGLLFLNRQIPNGDSVIAFGKVANCPAKRAKGFGDMLGAEIVKLLPNGGKIAVFVGNFAADNAAQRLGGIEAAIKGKNIEIIAKKEDGTDRAKAQLHATVGRLESLSPLAVLGRGYAVAWNADKTRIVRNAATVAPGDTVHVALERGALECEVRSKVD